MTAETKTINALTQYVELFDTNSAMIDAGSAPALNRLRCAARNALEGKTLPTKRTEGYARTSVNDMFAPDRGINLARIDMGVNPAESFRCGVPNLSTRLGIVANDTFHPTATLEAKLSDGVMFGSLRKAALEHPELIGRYYGSVAPIDNAMVALNTMLVQDGVVIYIPRGVRLSKPLQLVNIFNAATPMMAVRRALVIAEEGSEAHLLVCDHTAPGAPADVDYLSSLVVEVVLNRDARVDICDIEEADARTTRMVQTFVRQEQGSHLQLNSMSLDGGTTRNEFTINLVGEGASALLAGMAIATGNRHIDNQSDVVHLAPHCTSRQLFKYVLDDRASGAFEGGIRVDGSAPFTEAYQSNRNVLASADATMHSSPKLEIYNDDVKCSHGATTGQLDSEALFYMQTRGIPQKEARNMLMQAFMTDVIDTVTMPGLRERLIHLVDCRFNRNQAHCSDCNR